MNKKTFKAQALAIVMVALVISSVIGVAVFSRMSKDKKLAVEEQNSAEAAEISGSVLDVLAGADIQELESAINDPGISLPIQDLGGIKKFMNNSLNLTESANALPEDDGWCEGATSGEENTYVTLNVDTAEAEDFVEVQPGSVLAYNLVGAEFDTATYPICNLQLGFEARENDGVVFAIKYAYDSSLGNEDVFKGYCAFTDGTTDCSIISSVDPQSSLTDNMVDLAWTSPSYALVTPIDLITEHGNGLREVRILPIRGVVAVSTEVLNDPSCINKQFSPIMVTADATCQGSNRASEMTLPGSGNLGYSPLFDYGIYDNGFFQP